MRKKVSFPVQNLPQFKENLLGWAQQYSEITWLDSNNTASQYSSFDALLAVDGLTVLQTDTQNAFSDLKEYQNGVNDYIFGYLSYDLKNDTEVLYSRNTDGLKFPDLFFFQPKKIIQIVGGIAHFEYLNMVADEIADDFKSISNGKYTLDTIETTKNVKIKLSIFKDEYFRRVNQMLSHIHRGDIYEANFCQEFFARETSIDAYNTYLKLNSISKAPFSSFFKCNDKYALSASPERYIKKVGNKVISQPIKGTAKRSKNEEEDSVLKNSLANDKKERAENIMIVDLVRNDLSKSALKGSVMVEELCKVYSFEQVHQMISTISANVSEEKNPVEIIQETFPMGSMTGAPKIAAMKIVEKLEPFKRGLYSGAIGYFTPDGDFDFNVVIRSILYNASEEYVSYAVGGAITAKSVPEKEYEECLLKAKAMRQVLENN